MISRVAESCFWLHRYMERADNTARLLRANRSFVLDLNIPLAARWRPVLVVSGEHERFPELYPDQSFDDGEQVQHYMTWNDKNPTSIISSLHWARENARGVREIISTGMWETLNSFWHWVCGKGGMDLYENDRDAFYRRVRDASALFLGLSQNTVTHDDSFAFMQLGVYLERAGQTARMIDVKHHMLGPTERLGANGRQETALETAHAMALLRSCSAYEPFAKRSSKAPSGPTVVRFLYAEKRFPRSIRHCLHAAKNCLDEIEEEQTQHAFKRSLGVLTELIDSVDEHANKEHFEPSLHIELTRLVESNAALCSAIHSDYFDPSIESTHSGSNQTQ